MLVEIQEVVALQQLVCELRKAQSVASRTVQTLLHTLLSHHIVDGDVLAHLTGKVEESEVLHPIVVVDHDGGIGFFRLKVEELGHLLLDALLIMTQCLIVEQIALLTFARRVANHTCGTTNKDDGAVAATLQMTKHHDTAQVSDVQRVGSGVSTQVGCYHLLLQQLFCSWHYLCQHAAPFQFFNKILHISYTLLYYILTFTRFYGTGS